MSPAVAAGAYHGLALENDGTLVAWGYNTSGQTNVPSNLTNVVALAGGFFHSLALKSDGTVAVWGGNNFGQLNLPAGLTNVVAIAAGAYHSLALKADGSVVAWGNDSSGQTNVPADLNNAVAIAAGINHSLALRADGTVAAWGGNSYGQTNVPVGLTNVVAISSGENFALALRRDGTMKAWGSSGAGQTNVPPSANAISITSGQNCSFALAPDGTVAAWGDNSSGQLNLPSGLTNLAQLAGGMNFSLAIAEQAPLAIPQTNSGFVNHDLPVTLNASAGDGPSLNFRILTLPQVGNLFQISGGARGNAINTPGTPVSDPAGKIFFAPATNAVGYPYDQFSFAANDGWNDSPPATVTANIGLPIAPQFANTAGINFTGGTFGLSLNGSSHATYSVWASANLSDWNRLGTATETTPGIYQFTDPTVTNLPERFYRLTAP